MDLSSKLNVVIGIVLGFLKMVRKPNVYNVKFFIQAAYILVIFLPSSIVSKFSPYVF